MTDEAALLAAVAADPADDTPRLAFADWLDDHADPGRAAVVRLQCEAARYDPDDPRLAPLLDRLRPLFAAHARDIVAPFAPFLTDAVTDTTTDRNGRSVAGGANDNYLTFERGFPAELILGHPGDLGAAGAWTPPGGPGPGLTLRDPVPTDDAIEHPSLFDRWAATRLFEWCDGVRLVFDDSDRVTDLHLEDLSGVPRFTSKLHGLSVRGPFVTDFGALTFLRSAAVPWLTVVEFDTCNLTPAVVDALAGSPRYAPLRSLMLSDSIDLHGEIGRLVRPDGWPELRDLDLSGGRLEDDDARELGRAESFGRVESLNLAGNRITREGFAGLLRSSRWPSLERLDVTGNPLTAADVRGLQRRFGEAVRIAWRG